MAEQKLTAASFINEHKNHRFFIVLLILIPSIDVIYEKNTYLSAGREFVNNDSKL